MANMTTDPAQIADKLTKAQRRAIQQNYGDYHNLTPLGLAVRAHLLKDQSNG